MAAPRYTLGYYARVGVEYQLEGAVEAVVIKTHKDNAWDIGMSPYMARKLAKQLIRMANTLEPPKPKKKPQAKD